MTEQDSATLRCDVLGPLRVRRNRSTPAFPSLPQQVVFAVLALHANRPVGRDQLIDSIWGSTVPTYAVNLVQKRMSELRRVLEPDRSPGDPSRILNWTDRGYVLSIPDDGLDLWQHRRELDRARVERSKGDLRAASHAIHAALGLWRGFAFEGLSSPLLDAERERLSEARTTATEDRIELELALGTDVDLIPELRTLVAKHPLRDRLRGLLMLALYRGGRQADALAVYHDTRQYLLDELGIDPGGELQDLYRQILMGDPSLSGPDGVRADVAGPTSGQWRNTPAELPHGLPHFSGRTVELAELDALVATEHSAQQMMIVAIAGTAGVGKTALAVQWAHSVRGRFPDGQLYVNLRGFDPTGSAMDPANAVRGFLDALALDPQRIPVSLEGQAALFRSMLAGRRLLILLDNARDAEQVRRLLPGASGCLVIVTSRNQLAGLVATDGAHPVDVDLLSPEESRRLLERRLGADRVAAEPVPVDQIIDACARLPLALTIAAARAASRPRFPLAELAAELRDVRVNLDVFGGDDEKSDVRAVFSWSYHRLSEPARRLFRLFGVHPSSPDLSIDAAASLVGEARRRVRPMLTELMRANLLIERQAGRFSMHDLLRAYATELAHDEDSAEHRLAAAERAIDCYLHTAYSADRLLAPHRDDPISLGSPRPAITVTRLIDEADATRWFGAERFAVLAAVRLAADLGLDPQVWQLSWALTHHFEHHAYWHESVMVSELALDATRRLADPAAEAMIHQLLSRPLARLTRFGDAHGHLDQALAHHESTGDAAAQAHVHRITCWALEREGRYSEALEHAQQALELFRRDGSHRPGEARVLNAIGWFHGLLSDATQALEYCRQALAVQQEVGDRAGEAETWDSLGYLYARDGDHSRSMEAYEHALAIYRSLGDRYNEADTLAALGDAREAAGDAAAARAARLHALAIFERIAHPDAARVRAKLEDPEAELVTRSGSAES